MADAKSGAKPAPSKDIFDLLGGFYKSNFGSPVAFLGFVVFVIVLIVVYLFSTNDSFSVSARTYVQHYLGPYLQIYETISTVMTMMLIVMIILVLKKTGELNANENRKYRSIDVETEEVEAHDLEWEAVWTQVHSETPADWRLAILHADSMLDEALKRAGAKGDTLGERLKSLDPGNFQTLQLAWDAHKVRNLIAHEGINFQLTEREAKRVIDMYHKVLEELRYV